MIIKRMSRILPLVVALLALSANAAATDVQSTKKERNFIKKGNQLYEKKQYAEAAEAYRNALQENMSSEIATYNLASALANTPADEYKGDQADAKTEAANIFAFLAANAPSKGIAAKSLHNLGNMEYNNQQYQKAIEYYKGALRKDPDNDKTRQNLRQAH